MKPLVNDNGDWHPEYIKYLLALNGLNFAQLERIHGLQPKTIAKAIRIPIKDAEKAIANVINVPAYIIWPSRYDSNGHRLTPQPAINYNYKKIKSNVNKASKDSHLNMEVKDAS